MPVGRNVGPGRHPRRAQRVASNRVNAVLFGEICQQGPFLPSFPCGREFRVGTFGDIGLSYALVAPVPRGATSAIVRITAANVGPIAADRVSFGVCSEFPNGFGFAMDVPDACPRDRDPVCFMGGVAWRIDAVPAGGQASCQLRLVFGGPLLAARGGALFLQGVSYAGDGTVWDGDAANDTLSIGVAPQDPSPVPLGWTAWLALCLATFASGITTAARRRAGRAGKAAVPPDASVGAPPTRS